MTTPPQGPWGPGQPGGQPGGPQGGNQGQGGWGQQQPGQGGWGQRPPQQGQPPHGQPPQGQPPQGGGGWGQQPGQPPQGGQPGQTGWGQRPGQQGPQQGGGYQQQPWGRQDQQQGGWHQQQGQQPWQPTGPSGPGGGGNYGKDKMPLFIGGGIVGVVLIGLLVFLGIRALGGDDEATPQPTTNPQPTEPTGAPETPGGDPTAAPPAGELGNATGQAKAATDKLQADGYQCSDLFNGAQGAHRGCFKYDGATSAEVIFQFQSDGTVHSVMIRSENDDNVNNAGVTFDAALQALGNDAFGGSEVAKVQQAVKNGQRTQKVGSTWGEFSLRNDGERLQLSGGKSGTDSLDVPRKQFQTTQTQLINALKAKKYACQTTSSCRKRIGQYGSQSVYAYASQGAGLRTFSIRTSGSGEDVKAAWPAAVADGFAVLKGPDVAALKAWVEARNDGKSYAGYVGGWRVEISGDADEEFGSRELNISNESFYV